MSPENFLPMSRFTVIIWAHSCFNKQAEDVNLDERIKDVQAFNKGEISDVSGNIDIGRTELCFVNV